MRFRKIVGLGVLGFGVVTQAALPVFDAQAFAQWGEQIKQATAAAQNTLDSFNQLKTNAMEMMHDAIGPAMDVVNQLDDLYGQFDSAYSQLQQSVGQVRDLANSLSSVQGALNAMGINTSGGIEGLVGSFKDVSGYKSDPCYASTDPGACNQLYGNSMDVAIAATKATADSLLKGVQQTQDGITKDMQALAKMHDSMKHQQSNGGIGAVYDSVSFGNQIALKLNDQLAQMRALQTAQMAMMATRQEAESARIARGKAASDKLFGVSTSPTISRPATSY